MFSIGGRFFADAAQRDGTGTVKAFVSVLPFCVHVIWSRIGTAEASGFKGVMPIHAFDPAATMTGPTLSNTTGPLSIFTSSRRSPGPGLFTGTISERPPDG